MTIDAETRLERRVAHTTHGDISYLEVGPEDAPPVLFVHGIPTSGHLWRHVLGFLGGDLRCIAPDLLGLGETRPAPDARFDMDAQADMLLELMTRLGHPRFGLVCHDQGGAAAQIIVATQPERVRCLVLTDCVCYDNWPVPAVARYQALARLGPLLDWAGRLGLTEWVETSTPLSALRRGVHRPERFAPDAMRAYLRPLMRDRAAREACRRFLLAGHPRYTQLAVEGLRRFEGPTQVLWAADDVYLSPSWGRRLYEDIPGAESFELVPFCGHFWQEERPAEFASHMGAFLVRHLVSAGADEGLRVLQGG